MKNKLKITDKLLKVIPGGAHTYSRGYDQFPSNVPEILIRGKGAYVFDNQARRYLDYGMGLRSVNIGYSEPQINRAAIKQILNGNNLTRPSSIELKAASKLVETIKSAEMVKFTKNGSTAVTAAIKLSRAYTKRNLVLRCSNHPFFSYDDWFIGNTVVNRGVPNKIKEMTINFEFNNIKAFKNKIKKFKNKIACVVMEPATDVCPKNIFDKKDCCMNYPCNREFKKKILYMRFNQYVKMRKFFLY